MNKEIIFGEKSKLPEKYYNVAQIITKLSWLIGQMNLPDLLQQPKK